MQCYAITDRSLLAPGSRSLERRSPEPLSQEVALQRSLRLQVQQWIAAGIEWVQLREKDLPQSSQIALVRSLAPEVRRAGSRARLLVNGLSPRLALESGAHGVHLPGGATVRSVQAAVHVAGIVTVSCHTLQEVEAARAGGACAVLWAPVFGKIVAGKEVQAGTGLPALEAACAAAFPMPVFALGGVSAVNAPACIAAGAAGVAGIRLFHGEAWRALR